VIAFHSASPLVDRGVEATDVEPDGSGAEFLTDHGLDRRRVGRDRDMAALDEMRRNLARIEHEPEARPLSGVGCDRRSRYGMDGKPKLGASEAQTARLHKRFPGLSQIGSASEDGVGVSSRRGQFEV
jgi:hypothetical protein